MRAVTIVDGALVVREHPDPVAGAGEILVAVRAAGLNGADMLQRKGRYPVPPGAPKDIPGLEFAGEVIATGPRAARFKVGDRVMAVVAGGGQAERIVLHEREAMLVPAGLSWAEAGAFSEVFMTAHDVLFTQGRLACGERLCVHGAAGGVGMAAVQLAAAAGVRVTATVRSAAVRARVMALGAKVIDPSETQAHGPYDMILELVGAANLATNLASLNRRGRIAIVGITGGGGETMFDFRAAMKVSATIFASSLRARPLEQKADAARKLETHVLPLFDAGKLEVPIQAQFALADAEAAYASYQTPGKFGKIVLLMP
jgi:NADPH2:quinone reductase